ncbi:MAG: serine/threonine protein kinase [Myxococcales bacterium]|jgi:serine/threonine-protein kinase|nr:serine/threonine protein kinase [Myxococcales bacterium]MBL0193908.1 serine/threonine protein kinase [Myxococcales bacterium]HQY62097.1 serine/threonine-protein kinase [Polyangiaceae bacterium]
MQLEEGKILAGRYRLVKLLGEGGMGAVWEALHLVTLKPVALKYLKPRGHGGADESGAQRFLLEARAASAVRHPNVVKIHDVLALEGALFMVMDLLEGESLEGLLGREPRLSLRRTSEVLAPVVSAVRAAHAVGIVHRDLKPANIFLSRARGDAPELVQVLDFGIAKVLSTDGTPKPLDGKLTATGAVLGTPYYMAPEQAWGEAVDTRADIWALGIVLYECLAGRRPFEADNMGQLLKAIANQAYVPLAQCDPALPPALTSLVAAMIQTDRRERLGDLAPLSAELARHVGGRESVRVTVAHVSGPPGPPVDPLSATTGSDAADAGSAGAKTDATGPGEATPAAQTLVRPPPDDSVRSAPLDGLDTSTPLAGATVPPPPRRSAWPLVATAAVVAAGGVAFAGAWRHAASAPPSAPLAASAPVARPSASAPVPAPAPPAVASASPSAVGTAIPPAAPSHAGTHAGPHAGTAPHPSAPAAKPSAAPQAASSGAGGLHVPPPF